MGLPQKENGYTPIANEIMEQLAIINLSAYETRVLLFLFRKTYGWSKKGDYIPLVQFEEGTNLKRKYVSRALRQLEKKLIIRGIRGEKRTVTWYQFNKKYSEWIVDKPVDKVSSGIPYTGTSPIPYTGDTGVSPIQGHSTTITKTMILNQRATKLSTRSERLYSEPESTRDIIKKRLK